MVHALLKTMKTEPEEPALDVKTPANVVLPKPRLVLTPKPTPTPRRPKPKKPATPLSGMTALPNTGGTSQEFDRILTRSEQDFDRIQKRYQRLKQQKEDPESTQPKKKTLGKHTVKRFSTPFISRVCFLQFILKSMDIEGWVLYVALFSGPPSTASEVCVDWFTVGGVVSFWSFDSWARIDFNSFCRDLIMSSFFRGFFSCKLL